MTFLSLQRLEATCSFPVARGVWEESAVTRRLPSRARLPDVFFVFSFLKLGHGVFWSGFLWVYCVWSSLSVLNWCTYIMPNWGKLLSLFLKILFQPRSFSFSSETLVMSVTPLQPPMLLFNSIFCLFRLIYFCHFIFCFIDFCHCLLCSALGPTQCVLQFELLSLSVLNFLLVILYIFCWNFLCFPLFQMCL